MTQFYKKVSLVCLIVTMGSSAMADFFYGKAALGVGLVQNTPAEFSVNGGSSVDLPDPDLGSVFPVILAFGYKIGPALSLEGEYSFRKQGFDNSDASSSYNHFGLNLNLALPIPALPITPYGGGGLLLQSVSGDDSDLDFSPGLALQFFGGAYYDINPIVSVGFELRYLISVLGNKSENGVDNVTQEITVDYDNLAALLTFKVGF